jgi:hypothetical protein
MLQTGNNKRGTDADEVAGGFPWSKKVFDFCQAKLGFFFGIT